MKRAIYAILLVAIVVGAYVAGTWHGKKSGSGGSAGARKILYYVDPMHPAYKSDKPGIAPDCGMQLEPVYEDGGAPTAGPGVAHPGAVNVAPEQRQMLGVRVAKAEKSSGAIALRLFGKVAADETRIYRITAAIDGWVRKSYPVSAGSLVRKDQILATYYAPEFLGPQQAYIYAMGAMDRFQATGKETQGQIDQTNLSIRQYRDSLANMGMADRQIDDIARDRRFTEEIWVISPANGFLLARNITEGERFDKGRELFRVADLGTVWILVDAPGGEVDLLKAGTVLHASIPKIGKTVRVRLSEVLPQFDPATRTTRVRLEAENPGYLLRPDMFVDLEVPVRYSSVLAVPADAVIDSGVRKTVYVERGNGVFEPREVETGRRLGDRVEVVRGLTPGESIVVSGNFLVDSESRMKLAAAGIYGASHIDPVCGMHVDEGKAKAAGKTVDHGGKTYYFCSDECVGKFRKEPAKYLKGAAPKAKKETPKPAPMAHGGNEKGAMPAAAGSPPKEASAKSDEVPMDPVCGMVVDPTEAKAAGRVSEHKGKTYYFCADMCRQRFDANPESFLSKPGKGGMGAGQEDHGEHGKDSHGGHGK